MWAQISRTKDRGSNAKMQQNLKSFRKQVLLQQIMVAVKRKCTRAKIAEAYKHRKFSSHCDTSNTSTWYPMTHQTYTQTNGVPGVQERKLHTWNQAEETTCSWLLEQRLLKPQAKPLKRLTLWVGSFLVHHRMHVLSTWSIYGLHCEVVQLWTNQCPN